MPDRLEAHDDAVEQNVAGSGDLPVVFNQLPLLQSYATLTTTFRVQTERKQIHRSCGLNVHKSLLSHNNNNNNNNNMSVPFLSGLDRRIVDVSGETREGSFVLPRVKIIIIVHPFLHRHTVVTIDAKTVHMIVWSPGIPTQETASMANFRPLPFIGHVECTQCIRCGLLQQMSHVAWSMCECK